MNDPYTLSDINMNNENFVKNNTISFPFHMNWMEDNLSPIHKFIKKEI